MCAFIPEGFRSLKTYSGYFHLHFIWGPIHTTIRSLLTPHPKRVEQPFDPTSYYAQSSCPWLLAGLRNILL
ncbi:hypothetical protein L1987_18708 [Smallanthus sonchifolius]|uniref:Uncharacterized protein n=1 Tax=Smallanthus sonchifolius TaxID=185202 RepID=A0ACB9J3Y3_9ASTR|nr:hypothetical protein L1987_18708 [Smallanthus sonchifolius]